MMRLLPRYFRSRSAQRIIQYILLLLLLFVVFPLTFKWAKNGRPINIYSYYDNPNLGKNIPEGVERHKRTLPRTENGEIDYAKLDRVDWHDYSLMQQEKLRKGNGEQGSPYVLPSDPETKKKEDAIYRVNGFNGLVSDQIALNRSLKDIRHPGCKKRLYVEALPTVSVVVPFHNEHWSTLLRTAITLMIRSPKSVLREIILVDDASTKTFLKGDLDRYIAKHLAPTVKVVRSKKREGLIRARQIGARHATSDIIVFLDSHSEPNWNWLPPLIEPIALDYRTAVCPFVDVIDCDTFEYKAQDEGGRGSFDWEFNYKRLPVPEAAQKDKTAPFDNPVMAGGYFAISRKWFWELGGYDEGLDIWGGEQYELSFKIWQCHGRLLDTPCSRVGHIYRCKHVPFPNPGVGDFISRNYRRVADVWMDEYKKHLTKRRPEMESVDPGDLSKQREVRDRLQCLSFKWFMTKVAYDQDKFYPAIEPPDGASGELKNIGAEGKCIDTQFLGKDQRFGLRKCISIDASGGGEQNMRLSFWQDIRPHKRSMCFDVSTSVHKAPVVLFPCHGMGGNQHWQYSPEKKQLYHKVSNMCLDCDPERGEIFMSTCNPSVKSQMWSFQNMNKTVLQKWKKENN